MKFAAIDVGTNSTRLLVVDTIGTVRRDLYRSAVVTRLGQGTAKTKRIDREAIDRTIATVKEYSGLIEDFDVSKVRAVATSAARDAVNVEEFKAAFHEAAGFSVEILDGRQEAELTFTGAVACSPTICESTDRALVVDVGGGSTEFIWGSDRRIENFASIDVGSVRLTEVFVKNDPPTRDELDSIRDFVSDACAGVLKKANAWGIEKAIAVAGTATTLAAVKLRLEIYDPEAVHGSILSEKDIGKLIDRFLAVKTNERSLITGLQAGRADIIIAGALILEKTLSLLQVDRFIVSERDILDGLIDSLIGQ